MALCSLGRDQTDADLLQRYSKQLEGQLDAAMKGDAPGKPPKKDDDPKGGSRRPRGFLFVQARAREKDDPFPATGGDWVGLASRAAFGMTTFGAGGRLAQRRGSLRHIFSMTGRRVRFWRARERSARLSALSLSLSRDLARLDAFLRAQNAAGHGVTKEQLAELAQPLCPEVPMRPVNPGGAFSAGASVLYDSLKGALGFGRVGV